MSILLLTLIVLVLLGLAIWLIRQAPFDATIKWLMMAVAVIAAIWVIALRAGLA